MQFEKGNSELQSKRRMNYESLNEKLLTEEKVIKDNLAQLQKLFKALNREREAGDVKSLTRDMNVMEEAIVSMENALKQMKEFTAEFDTKEYFENGDFATQMLEACEEKGVDVRGEFPVYEMFPYKVKIDTENQDLYLDRKKVQCMRPVSFVNTVKEGQEKLNRAAFNAQIFAGELAEAYDMALLKMNKRSGTDVYLNNLYKYLAPMSRFRKEYDQQSFAFDLARLYGSEMEETKSGRKFQFGPSRNNNKAIRILDKEGKEQFLATICFYDQTE